MAVKCESAVWPVCSCCVGGLVESFKAFSLKVKGVQPRCVCFLLRNMGQEENTLRCEARKKAKQWHQETKKWGESNQINRQKVVLNVRTWPCDKMCVSALTEHYVHSSTRSSLNKCVQMQPLNSLNTTASIAQWSNNHCQGLSTCLLSFVAVFLQR